MIRVILLLIVILNMTLTLLGSIYVMIIAVGEYKYGLTPLPKVLDEAEKLERFFKDFVLSEEDLILLKNPSAGDIKSKIVDFLRGKKETDFLILFYSGHGVYKGGKIYLAGRDTDPKLSEEISMVDLLKFLREGIDDRKVRMLVILDTCLESTKSLESVKVERESEDMKFLVERGVNFLFSTRIGEEALEKSGFVEYLMKSFEGIADFDEDKWVELKEIWQYVQTMISVINYSYHSFFIGDPQFRIIKVGLGTLIVKAVNELAKTGEIFINGEKVGDLSTGKFERKLPVGMYKLVVKGDQIEEYVMDINMKPYDIWRVNILANQEPEYEGDEDFKVFEGFGELEIKIDTKDEKLKELARRCEIFLNGKKVGDLSKGEFKRKLPVGRYRLEIKGEGLESLEEDIKIERESIWSFSLKPVIKSYLIEIESEPSEAEVYIDGEFRGYTPLKVKLKWGESYDIVVEKKGYNEWRKENFIPSDKVKKLVVPLLKNKPPFRPVKISPSGMVSASGPVILEWKAYDEDDDSLRYDLYFGLSDPPPICRRGLSRARYEVDVMPGKEYYWRVVVKDGHGNETQGPVWSFKTKSICTLTIVSQPIGNIPIKINGEEVFAPFKGSFEVGEEIEIEIPDVISSGDIRYKFNSWSDGDNKIKRKIVLSEDEVLKANYLRLYFINIKVEGQGLVKVETESREVVRSSKVWVKKGDNVTLKAFPGSGWIFVKWIIIKGGKTKGIITSSVVNLQGIDSDLEILALFKQEVYPRSPKPSKPSQPPSEPPEPPSPQPPEPPQ